jgi:hypothetical protein
MIRRSWLGFMMLFAASTVLAQGSGSMGGPKANFEVTKDLKGWIREIDVEKGFMIVEMEPQSDPPKLYRFSLDSKTRFKADKKTALAASKKKIEVSDFTKGQVVRVSYKASAPQAATEMRLLQDKGMEAKAEPATGRTSGE